MSGKPSGAPPPLPTFPNRLSLSNAIWETVISKEDDEEEGEELFEEIGEDGDGEFMDDGFREDLRKLEVCAYYTLHTADVEPWCGPKEGERKFEPARRLFGLF